MKIVLNIKEEDLVSFYQFHNWYSPERNIYRIQKRVKYGLISTTPFWVIILSSQDAKINSTVGLVIFGLFFFSLGFLSAKQTRLFFLKALAKKIVASDSTKDIIGKITIEFLNDRIVWEKELSRGERHNDTISKIMEDEKNYYLYNTSRTTLIIPKSAFVVDTSRKDFEYLLKSHFKRADLKFLKI